MPAPRSLTTAPHRDFDLEVVAGAWPADISGEVLYSSPLNGHGLPYAIFDFGAICRLVARARHPRRGARPVPLAERGHRDARASGCGTAIPSCSPAGRPATSRRSGRRTAPTPRRSRGATACTPPGTPAARSSCTPAPSSSWPRSATSTPGAAARSPWAGSCRSCCRSAHPVADPERHCLWTVKLELVTEPSVGMRPSLVRYDRDDGTQVRHWPLDGITFGGSVHTVSQTRDWVILCDSGNFKADVDEMFGGERTATIDDEVPVWLIRKDALEGLAVRHAGHAGVLHDVTAQRPLLRPVGRHRRDLGGVGGHGPHGPRPLPAPRRPRHQRQPRRPRRGRSLQHGHGARDHRRGGVRPARAARCSSGASSRRTGRSTSSSRRWTGAPRAWRRPTLHHVTYQGCRPGNVSARAATLYEGRIDLDRLREETPGALCSFERGSMELKARWQYTDAADHLTSPAFAPRAVGATAGASAHAGRTPGGHDGYVVQPVCNDDGLRIEVFDAGRVGAGPIATLMGSNKETIPLILHAAWSPAHHDLADAERLRFSVGADGRVAGVGARGPAGQRARGGGGVRRPLVNDGSQSSAP